MTTVNVHEAKTRLLQLIAEAETGGEVVVTRNSRPVARLVRFSDPSTVRRFEALSGRTETCAAFLDPLPEAQLAAWE